MGSTKWTIFMLIIASTLGTTVEAFTPPLIFGHRGASGHRPEHTLASYQLAIDMGADYIEPDLVMTKDGVLMARHENEISGTTDVATKFPDRKTTKKVDGKDISGWFIEDFTLKEMKTLKANERLPFRNQTFNGKYEIPTFKEVLALVKKQKKVVGIIPETKHPTYFQSINLPLEEALIKDLKEANFNKSNSPVIIQSFELTNLKKLKTMTKMPLVYLLDDPELVPFDHVVSGDKRTYKDMLTIENLKEISKTANAIGPYKRYIIPEDEKGNTMPPTELIKNAHDLNMKVYPYTFRSESQYLLKSYSSEAKEYEQFFELGVDGVFSDFPDHAVAAKNIFLKSKKSGVK